MDMYWFFDWIDTSLLADAAKAYGGVYVIAQMIHLLGLAMLGGMVIAGDLRLLGVLMTNVPSQTVIENTHKGFRVALVVLILSGIFLTGAVSLKLYYNEMFWAKMAGLATGIVFVYAIRRPLLKFDHDSINPWALRLTAIASLCIWFTVAASGRWIGFS
jgi:hypothetical protein